MPIVISQALSLAAETDLSLALPVIGWDSIVTSANVAASTEETGFPASNLANVSTYLRWKGVAASPAVDEELTITTGTVDPIDFVGLARHNFGTAGMAVSVGWYDDSTSPATWTELVEPSIPADDAPLLLRFEAQSLAQVVVRLAPGSAAPEAAVLYAGALLVMERGVQGGFTPLPFGRSRTVVTGRSESGNYLGRIITGAKTQSKASFQNLTETFLRAELDAFLDAAGDTPFFFAWSPLAYPDEAGFAWLENDPQPSIDVDRFVAVELDMVGIVS